MRNTLRSLLAVMAMAIVLAMPGCAVLDATMTKVDENRLVLQYGMLRIIDGDADKANEVLRVSRAVQAATSAWQVVTIDQFVAEAEKHIPWAKMHPADQMIVREFLPVVAGILMDGMETGKLNPESRLRLDAVFSWIETAAYMSGAG